MRGECDLDRKRVGHLNRFMDVDFFYVLSGRHLLIKGIYMYQEYGITISQSSAKQCGGRDAFRSSGMRWQGLGQGGGSTNRESAKDSRHTKEELTDVGTTHLTRVRNDLMVFLLLSLGLTEVGRDQ